MLMEQDVASNGFIPIGTAPRDGTRLTLAWLNDDGTVGESFGPMHWTPFIGNPMAQEGKGIWACYDSEGTLLYTWSEANKDGAPTHYKIYANENEG